MIPHLLLLVAAVQQQPSLGWQQHVTYDITASLDESSGVLSGTEQVTYQNRSPDTLTSFSLHLHLNAFRPGSRWSDRDSVEGRRRFNDLQDPDFAFNHVRNVRIMGQAATPVYPFAPDSTIVRFELPRPLAPGGEMTVEMEWDARPSTTPRRQGRRGRRFDFAQWYPKVVVYDTYGWAEQPLYPAGEFYGEFGDYTVRLDVPEDQVIGATGVPVCGDPGWERASQQQGRAIEYRRDEYGSATAALEDDCGGAAAGRKRIVWYAEDVHHFAMSLNPDYRYEGGHYGDVAVHVLYQPGDEQSWGGGVAVERTEIALAWLDSLYGPFAWPQLTNVHRIEGGGTEFPMMIMDGSAGQGLILHELGHNYTMGILANNEWREGWLDEGFTSFQSTWAGETFGAPDEYHGLEEFILGLDLQGLSEPTSLRSEDYSNFTSYNISIYSRGELFFHQLRYIVGDEVMREILRTFYDRWKLRHVNEAAFRSVAEEVSGMDLSTFFGQFLHGVPLYDYAVAEAKRERQSDGGWITRVLVERHEEGRIPVDVAVIGDGDTTVVRIEGLAAKEWVEVPTTFRPAEVMLDPRVRTHDWNMLNNRHEFGLSLPKVLTGYAAPVDVYPDPFFAERSHRDRLALGLAPTAWYNDVGGLTLGLRSRSNYLGQLERKELWASYATGALNGDLADEKDFNFAVRGRNPVWLRAPGFEASGEGFYMEGRAGARIGADWTKTAGLGAPAVFRRGLGLQWVGVVDDAYTIGMGYEDGGTIEAEYHSGVSTRSGRWSLSASGTMAGGAAYYHEPSIVFAAGETDRAVRADKAVGAIRAPNYSVAPYGRFTVEFMAKRPVTRTLSFGSRLFGGILVAEGFGIWQRQMFLGGAGPYDQIWNPFTRSRGALFRREDVYYHVPGDGNARGLNPFLSAPSLVALNLELDQTVLSRPRAGLFNRVGIALFGDVLAGNGSLASFDSDFGMTGDAGIGIRMAHRIGDTRFVTRFDVPLWVEEPSLAADADPSDRFAFRWVFGFQEAF
ncbi:MAG TPA: M1 family metallopeptidase [Gemmatimonadales bacterium]|nr:M1 family metallopeptidase [Gemmatimonadales bacterium]